MKTLCSIPLLILLLGCGGAGPRPGAALSATEAGLLARRLANEQAQALYQCQPFQDGTAARFEGERWLWRDRQAYGQCDLEATVSFASNGSGRTVRVLLLDNRSSLE